MNRFVFFFLGLFPAMLLAAPDRALVESVLGLKSGSKIPPSVYLYDSREIAEALVQRLEKRDAAAVQDPAKISFDFLNRSNIILAFPFKYFSSIQKSGFLNQFQVDHSANMDRKHRLIVEDMFHGLKLKRSSSKNDVANTLRPKYAYLTLDVDAETSEDYKILNGDHGLHISYDYGNIFAKFKDEVKKRSTFTAGDSLYILGAQKGDARTFTETQTTPGGAYEYWEAQIWGALTLDDVEYFLVNCSKLQGQYPEVSSAQIQEIKDSGHEVYQCVPKYENEKFEFARYRLDKGARL